MLTCHIAEILDHHNVAHKYARIGEIEVELRRCRKKAKSKSNGSWNFKGIGEEAVPEKAMKGRSISSHTRYVQRRANAAGSVLTN